MIQEEIAQQTNRVVTEDRTMDVQAINHGFGSHYPPYGGFSSDGELPNSTSTGYTTSDYTRLVTVRHPAFVIASQRKLRFMNMANRKVILQRLQEKWDTATEDILKEIEQDKEWWLYTAYEKLRSETEVPLKPAGLGEGNGLDGLDGDGENVLFLYHTQRESNLYQSIHCLKIVLTLYQPVAVDFLATLTSTTQFHHLSPPVGNTGRTKLPLPPHHFHHIHLPITISSLLPASSLPHLLEESARLLSTSSPSALHLTLLDPYPSAQTMGPLLQQWITTKLLLNLEVNFRCLSPCRLIPLWLKTTGLRVEPGSCVVRRFLGTTKLGQRNPEEIEEPDLELEVEVGRRLWWMVWGSFVQGGIPWWKDEDIVQECAKLRTMWECLEIEAIK